MRGCGLLALPQSARTFVFRPLFLNTLAALHEAVNLLSRAGMGRFFCLQVDFASSQVSFSESILYWRCSAARIFLPQGLLIFASLFTDAMP